MSKFYHNSSDSDSDSFSDPDIVQQKPSQKITYFESDDEDRTTKKLVLPEKVKRSQELNGLIKQLKNAKKIKDIMKCSELFEELVKSYDKCKKIVEKDGHFKQFIRCLGEFEDFINELWSDETWRASASGNNTNAIKKIRQRIKKYYKTFENELKDFKQNPSNYPEEEEKVVESLSESESESKSSESETSEASDSESDTSDTESSEEPDINNLDKEDILRYFLKKPDEQKDDKEKKEKKTKVKEKEIKEKSDDEESVQTTKEKPKLFNKDEEITIESVINKLNEICSSRGRKGTDKKEQIENMNELREIVKTKNLGQAMEVKILFNQIAVNFDYNPRLNKCMKTSNWNKCLEMIEELLSMISKNNELQVGENIPEDSENVAVAPYRVRGCPLTLIDRMTEEFIKILQQCDAHGTEYVDRLKDEPKICALIDTLQIYLEEKGTSQEICRIYLKKIENLYYKYDKGNALKTSDIMEKLSKYIYTMDNTDRIRTKAMLCHIYHHALHDRWFEARDLMLMSHLQESIEHSDIPLQILYNRTMVQIGLCAFRVGNIKESHAALLDIQSGNRAKELLAQGMIIQRNIEKTKEQEVKERQRLIPFHMHINLELLECVYLVSAMLIEIPYMCSREYETKKRMISKQFHYQLKISERQPVVGPPENMREHVVAASRAMKNGDWQACLNYLINEKMNAKVWDLIPQANNVKLILTEKIKEESMRTYLFKYSSVYESLSILNLSEMFELPKSQVYSSISKMIINEELMASLDEPTETVVMHRTEPTKLQTLALQLSEKITTLMDHTERIMQIKGGEIGTMFSRNQHGQQSQQNQQHQATNYFKHNQSNWNKNQGHKSNRSQRQPAQKAF